MVNGESQTVLSKAFIFFWFLVLISLAVFIRVNHADYFHYSPDEAMHTTIAGGQNLQQVLQYAHYEIHPPILYILTHYWMAFSTDPSFVRGLCLLLGALLIVIYYFIGKALRDPLTGVTCSLLVTFGMGCIIQSYTVRQYMPFLVFMSLSYYCYLRWQTSRSMPALLAYGAWAILACLTHFSAVISLFCIAACEMLDMLKTKATRRLQLRWIAINAVVAVIAIYTYHLWQPILVPLKLYFVSRFTGAFSDRLLHVLFYPLLSSGYILGYTPAFILLLCLAGFSCTAKTKRFHVLLKLNLFAYGLGMLLALTRIYPEPGLRHSLWILPFVIPPLGWMLADAVMWLSRRFPPTLITSLLLPLGFLTYNADTRFSDGSEYAMPEPQWQALTARLEKLGPRDAIVTDKDDGIMLTNLYRAMGNDAFTGNVMAKQVPVYGTQLIFNPYYPRYYNTDLFLATLAEAQARHWFSDRNAIVFLRLAWSRSPVTDLMLCPTLDKQIFTFPPLPAGHILTRGDIYNSYAALMILSASEVNDIISPAGKAHDCLDGLHDQVPQEHYHQQVSGTFHAKSTYFSPMASSQ